MRPFSSPYAFPAFLIANADPTAKPRWVNDYHALNENPVPDRHPLSLITEILSIVLCRLSSKALKPGLPDLQKPGQARPWRRLVMAQGQA